MEGFMVAPSSSLEVSQGLFVHVIWQRKLCMCQRPPLLPINSVRDDQFSGLDFTFQTQVKEHPGPYGPINPDNARSPQVNGNLVFQCPMIELM